MLIRSQYQPLTPLNHVSSCSAVLYADDSGAVDPGSTPIKIYFVFLFIIWSVQERDWSVQQLDKAIVTCLSDNELKLEVNSIDMYNKQKQNIIIILDEGG